MDPHGVEILLVEDNPIARISTEKTGKIGTIWRVCAHLRR